MAPRSRRKKKEGKKIAMGSPGDVVGCHWVNERTEEVERREKGFEETSVASPGFSFEEGWTIFI